MAGLLIACVGTLIALAAGIDAGMVAMAVGVAIAALVLKLDERDG